MREGGYQVGNFPVLWTEWNGKYRDAVRSYWKGDAGRMAEYAYRLTGSSDLYGDDGRNPYASINFITAHDGFTLHDLVAYNEKHNEANQDGGQVAVADSLLRLWLEHIGEVRASHRSNAPAAASSGPR